MYIANVTPPLMLHKRIDGVGGKAINHQSYGIHFNTHYWWVMWCISQRNHETIMK